MKNLKKGFAVVPIIIILAVLIIGSGAYYFVHKDSISSWKTYTNTQYGFAFQYPSTLNVSENKPYEITLKDSQGKEVVRAMAIREHIGSEHCVETKYEYEINKQKISGWKEICSTPVDRFVNYIIPDKEGNKLFDISSLTIDSEKLAEDIVKTITFTTKKYENEQYGFSMLYPIDARINDVDISGGRSISFVTSQGRLIVQAVTESWNNGVLSAPPSCNNDIVGGQKITSKIINGVSFYEFDVSKEVSSASQNTNTTEYCTVKNGTAYKLIVKDNDQRGSVSMIWMVSSFDIK
jgi:hypothetical protein